MKKNKPPRHPARPNKMLQQAGGQEHKAWCPWCLGGNFLKRFIFPLALIIATSTPCRSQQQITGEQLVQWVKGIEGKSPEGRNQFVKSQIAAMGLKYTASSFTHTSGNGKAITGENIIVSLGKGKRNVVVGAHYDAVPGSPGANDNGGGVAVVLGLLKSMKNFQWSFEIDFVFFDQEEVGLIGSQEFVRTYSDSSKHLAMINLDVEGTGDAVYVGPVGGGDDDVLMPVVRKAAKGSLFFESEYYPSSDHLSFASHNLENISISIVPKNDASLLIDAIKNNWQMEEEKVPEVLKTMHTAQDSSTYVSPASISKAFELVKSVLHKLNGSF